MVRDVVAPAGRAGQCWLYRCEDHSPFAYARGNEFFRYGDNIRWAFLRDDRLISARSGEFLAYRIGDVFHDTVSHEPAYYQPSTGAHDRD